MSLEQLFNSAVLDVAVPDTSLEYPPCGDTDDWLSRLTIGTAGRTQAFFDEQLQFFLIVRIDSPTPNDPVNLDHPPPDLLKFLSHLQVSLEATYISSTPVAADTAKSSRASVNPPPRSTSFGQAKSHDGVHPSIFPPPTPNPTPSTTDHDRRYIRSEGTLLLAKIWGQDTGEDSREAFSLLWSQQDQLWVALYRLSITVSFLRLNITNPLLCLTVSSTLREKPMTLTTKKHPLASFLAAKGSLPISEEPASPTTANGTRVTDKEPDELHGFEEVNLLEGLASGPTFSISGPERVSLPTTRLGGVTRRRLFSLPAVVRTTNTTTTPTPSPAPSTARIAHATLRKSFRKTLRTVSGFRVRMRTVFVPYVLLPEADDRAACLDGEEEEEERERREAGNDERTVVLCVEIENSGESGRRVGFDVEAVDVKVGGEGAKATLIGWGDQGAEKKNTFPLLINAMEQYNLLYAVSFQHPPGDVDGFSLTRGDRPGVPSSSDLQRAVTINIHGKPFLVSGRHPPSDDLSGKNIDVWTSSGMVSFPTETFSSRWNCVLDLSSNQHRELAELLDADGDDSSGNNALPEPASPFPTFSPRTASALGVANSAFPFTLASSHAVAGSRRHTTIFEAPPTGWSSMGSRTPTTSRPTSFLPPHLSSKQPPAMISKLGLNPPITAQYPSTPTPATTTTTYGPPLTARSDGDEPGTTTAAAAAGGGGAYDYAYASKPPPPPTPAYPAYPPNSALPPTPISLGPIANQSGSVGPSVEIRRERGMVMGGFAAVVPQTPGPTVAFGGEQMRYYRGDGNGNGNGNNGEDGGQSVVVSIGLLPSSVPIAGASASASASASTIYPLDRFTLDIFVFNQSARTRRFEVSYPFQRRRRQWEKQRQEGGVVSGGRRGGGGIQKNAEGEFRSLGILPLDNRIRIGPLLPATCQSVRMQFFALTPGVHMIDMLTLTDVETGYSMNLRSVMDVVVHERG